MFHKEEKVEGPILRKICILYVDLLSHNTHYVGFPEPIRRAAYLNLEYIYYAYHQWERKFLSMLQNTLPVSSKLSPRAHESYIGSAISRNIVPKSVTLVY